MSSLAKTFSLVSKFSFSNFSFIVPETPTAVTEYNIFQKPIFDFSKFIQFKQKFLIREHIYLHFQKILIPCPIVPFKKLTRQHIIEFITDYFKCFNVIDFNPIYLDGFINFHLSLLLNHRDVANNVIKMWSEVVPSLDDWRSLTTAFHIYPLGDFAKDILIDLILKGPMFRIYFVFFNQGNLLPEVIANISQYQFFRPSHKTLGWKTFHKMSEAVIKKILWG